MREERGYSSLTPDIREHDDRRRRTFMRFFFVLFFSMFVVFCFCFVKLRSRLHAPRDALPDFQIKLRNKKARANARIPVGKIKSI